MAEVSAQADAAAFLESWTSSILERDVEAARALRTDDYRCTTPDGSGLSAAGERAALAAPAFTVEALKTRLRGVSPTADGAMLRFDMSFRGDWGGGEAQGAYRGDLALVRRDGRWKAASLALHDLPGEARSERRPGSALRRLAGRLRRALPDRRSAGFQEAAYAPYRPGQDYRLERTAANAPVYEESALPVPPSELWLGYNYPAHGRLHVDTMLDTVSAAGLGFEPGDRILDLGCGAGRMIRHLAPLARTCEIWGADISAEHVLWCQRSRSPPFHFLTSTKVPHLPFADASFRFIYGGSLFTHIDDLARAWLLELRRLLRSDGLAYITIHDEQTVRLFEAYKNPPAIVRQIMSAPLWAEAKADSDMFTIGRDEDSQVFYARDWFERLLSPMFEIVTVRPEAYFYQTAILIRPRS